MLNEKQISRKLILKLKKQVEKLKALDCVVIDSCVASKTKMMQSYYNPFSKQLEFGSVYLGERSVQEAEKSLKERGIVLVPASPIYADCDNCCGYVADFCSGWSWIIPQIALLYCQTKAQYNIDFDGFADILSNSFSVDKRGLRIFDFEELKKHIIYETYQKETVNKFI